jgi:aerobic-type carbon monoxide dehydrogenase small subunit (CoxS/CutS family)
MPGSFSITRRGLFRGGTAAAVIAGCKPGDSSKDPNGDAGPLPPGRISPDPSPLEFVLNGKKVSTQAEPRITLAQLLRLDLDTTGTKVVCDRGACGACMVLVDGLPKNSCMMLAHDAAGAEVTTVEGVGSAESLSPLQRAFVKHDALQCGFCTSGMVVSCQALIDRTKGKRLAADDVKEAISGNLCRCGTYPHVVEAVLEVANGKEPA